MRTPRWVSALASALVAVLPLRAAGSPPSPHGSVAPAGTMSLARSGHTATLLKDGRVLVAGGGDRAEIFDPKTVTFAQAAGSLDQPRHFSTATLLADGRVLIVGGYPGGSEATNRAWIYQP